MRFIAEIPVKTPYENTKIAIGNDHIIQGVGAIIFALIFALLARAIKQNDEATKANHEHIRDIQEDLRKCETRIIEVKAECIKEEKIRVLEAKIDSLGAAIHRRVDEMMFAIKSKT